MGQQLGEGLQPAKVNSLHIINHQTTSLVLVLFSPVSFVIVSPLFILLKDLLYVCLWPTWTISLCVFLSPVHSGFSTSLHLKVRTLRVAGTSLLLQ